jgi:hypothetical protein
LEHAAAKHAAASWLAHHAEMGSTGIGAPTSNCLQQSSLYSALLTFVSSGDVSRAWQYLCHKPHSNARWPKVKVAAFSAAGETAADACSRLVAAPVNAAAGLLTLPLLVASELLLLLLELAKPADRASPTTGPLQ